MKKTANFLAMTVLGIALLAGCGNQVTEQKSTSTTKRNKVETSAKYDEFGTSTKYDKDETFAGLDEIEPSPNDDVSIPTPEADKEPTSQTPEPTTQAPEPTTSVEEPTPPKKDGIEIIIGTMEPYFDNEKGEVALLDTYTGGTVVLHFEPSRYMVLFSEDTYARMYNSQTGATFTVKTVINELYPERHSYKWWNASYKDTLNNIAHKEQKYEYRNIAFCDMHIFKYHHSVDGSPSVSNRYVGYYTTLPDGTTLMTNPMYYSNEESLPEQEKSLFKSITLYSTGKYTPEDPDLDKNSKLYTDADGNPLLAYYVYPEGLDVCLSWQSPKSIVVPDEIDGFPVVKYSDGDYFFHYDDISLGYLREIECASMSGSTLENFNDKISLKGVKRINLFMNQFDTSIIPEGIEYIASMRRNSSEDENFTYEMTFPSTLKKIEPGTFSEFEFLRKITFTESEQPLTIEDSAFLLTSISELELPDNVVYVGQTAFYINNAWEKLRLSKNLKYIGEKAFYDRLSKKEKDRIAVVPDGCIYVGSEAFGEWKVVIPDSVQFIGEQAHIITTAGSPAEAIAIENGYSYEIISEEEMAQYQSQYADPENAD